MSRYRAIIAGWLLSDLLLYIACYALAYFLRVGWILSNDFPIGPFLMAVFLSAPLFLLTLLTGRMFAFTRNQASLGTAAHILYASIVGGAVFALTYYFLYGLFFSRLLLLEGFAFSTIVLWIWHVAYEQIERSLLRRDPPTFPTLVVGVTRESAQLIDLLERHSNPLKPVAVLDGTGVKEKEIGGVPVVGKLDKLEETLDRFHITHLIHCSDLEQSINLLGVCRARRITYLILPSVLGIVERDERIESIEGRAATIVSPDSGWWQWFFR